MTGTSLSRTAATALDVDGETMVPMHWAQWIELSVRDQDNAVRTPSGAIRVPSVIVLSRFAKVPKRRPKFSSRALWTRDNNRCQYTGKVLKANEGNIDHILPRSRRQDVMGKLRPASKDVNSRKADRLPEEVGLRLLRPPVVPRELPSTHFIRNTHRIPEWRHFLVE